MNNPPSSTPPGSGKTGFLRSIVNAITGDNPSSSAGGRLAAIEKDIQNYTRALAKNPQDVSLYLRRAPRNRTP
jgi:ABC-type phosphate transport system ATPase subunit